MMEGDGSHCLRCLLVSKDERVIPHIKRAQRFAKPM